MQKRNTIIKQISLPPEIATKLAEQSSAKNMTASGYIANLVAKDTCIKLIGTGRKQLTYDEAAMTLTDRYGNVVKLTEKIDIEIEAYYIHRIFDALYKAQNETAAIIRAFRKSLGEM